MAFDRKDGLMDITFKTEDGLFNYRACAIIVHNGKLLAMRDEDPYYYLPGGRVQLHETAEYAVLREIKEELGVNADIVRPLWLNQSFFMQDQSYEKYHELCLYFLVDISQTDVLSKGDKFTIHEKNASHEFEWLDFKSLEEKYFYPTFLKKKIFDLPKNLTILTEYE